MAIPKWVVTAGLMAAQMALGAMRKIEGPRLEDLQVTVADYGTPIARFWGRRRLEGCPIIHAEKLKEKKRTSKTKGGKYANYRYFGTFAVLVADHEIDAVSRIWMDKHLVYDATGAGPISVASLFKGFGSQNMRIYLGTETQEPDPRMEAWCEGRYGPDSCPAYRGVSYIMFEELPLEKFGNRIPQITVEAVREKSNVYPFETRPTDKTLNGSTWSPDSTKLLIYKNDNFTIWDIPTRTQMISGTFPAGIGNTTPAISSDGSIWAASGTFGTVSLNRFSADGFTLIGASIPIPAETYPREVVIVPTANGEATFIIPSAPVQKYAFVAGAEIIVEALPFHPSRIFSDGSNIWAAGYVGASTTVGFRCISGPRAGEGTTLTSPVAIPGQMYATHNGQGKFVCYQGGHWYFVDDETFAPSAIITSVYSADPEVSMALVRSGDTSIWVEWTEISLIDLSVIRTIPSGLWPPGSGARQRYDRVNHAILTDDATPTHLMWRFLDRIGSAGTTLRHIVEDVAEWCGAPVDATALDQVVHGYSVTQGTGKDMIAPLLDIHDSDGRPHDFGVQFIKRGGASGGTVLTTDFAKDGDSPRYIVPIIQDTDLPRKITLTFADRDHDQQTNTVISQRPLDAVDSQREQTIDLATYVSIPDEAQKLADRYFRRVWNGRESHQLSLTAKQLALEPGDVRTLSLDGVTRNGRCTKLTISQGALVTEWERDFGGLGLLGTGTGGEMEGRDPEVIYIPSPTKGFVLDIPLLDDAHASANPQLYYAAGPYTGSWPGAAIYEGDPDGEDFDFEWSAVDSSQAAVWGHATTKLNAASPWLWDRGNAVTVRLNNGTLTSTTEAAIDADPTRNLAYIGGELVNFTTATLDSPGVYTLSGFKRGRRGTEWAVNTHAAGDEFVLAASLLREGVGLSEVGTVQHFKAQTYGRDIDSAPTISVPFAGATLKPYAPARVKAEFDGDDWTFTVIRRTRIGGAWVGGTTIPLGEASEAYEIEVYSGATLKRTLALTGTNTITYTEAQQIEDFGSAQTVKPTLRAYQLSDAVGRGFALAA